jgi:hypothetical protein
VIIVNHERKGLKQGYLSQYSNLAINRIIGVLFLAGTGNIILHHCIQTISGAHPPSHPIGIMVFPPVVKWHRA